MPPFFTKMLNKSPVGDDHATPVAPRDARRAAISARAVRRRMRDLLSDAIPSRIAVWNTALAVL